MLQVLDYTLQFNHSFQKDLKKLSKRFHTLTDDIQTFCDFSLPQFISNNQSPGYFRISATGIDYPEFYICKKIACKSIAGKGVNSGLRITFAFYPIEKQIRFIELFYKGDKDLEDFSRFKPDSNSNR